MTRFVFRYDINNRPRAEVTVCNGDKEIELAPIIDSGADITIIPKDIGEELNLSPPTEKELKDLEAERLSTASGSYMDYVLREVCLKIGELEF